MRPILASALLALTLFGCQFRSTREVAEEQHRNHETGNSAATIQEAAEAILQGAPPEGPARAIKRQAAAIGEAVGYPYEPTTTPSTPE